MKIDETLVDWDVRRSWPVPERHRHYHWGHVGTGLPWIEDRLYRDGPGVEWDMVTHGSVRPHGLQRAAPFHPIFRHFKVIAGDTAWCEVIGGSTYYRHHWTGLEHRTGVPFPVQRFEDLFVDRVPKYSRCDRFDGIFDQPWNLGEEFRPTGNGSDPANTESVHHRAAPTMGKSSVGFSTTSDPLSESIAATDRRLKIAFGPENPAFGSWNWLAVDLAQELSAEHDVEFFQETISAADIVVFFKFLPDWATLSAVLQRAAVLYCPVDFYGSAAEIDADAPRLRSCDHVVIHCRRLQPYFQSYVPTTYCDHHLKYTIPIRSDVVEDGPILWIGERSNVPPVARWINEHGLPRELVVVTNAPVGMDPETLGFTCQTAVRVEPWSPDTHRLWLHRCRAAIDVKGSDFRARHKPPAKALDYLASGIPLAVPSICSSRDHVGAMGFELAEPNNVSRWLSKEYAGECRNFGVAVSYP